MLQKREREREREPLSSSPPFDAALLTLTVALVLSLPSPFLHERIESTQAPPADFLRRKCQHPRSRPRKSCSAQPAPGTKQGQDVCFIENRQ